MKEKRHKEGYDIEETSEYMGLSNNDDCYPNDEPFIDEQPEIIRVNINEQIKKYQQSKEDNAEPPNEYDRNKRVMTRKGHTVRSKFERTVANFLFNERVNYVYEPELKLGSELFRPDFYLPNKKIYIECWGLNHLRFYMIKRIYKESIYKLFGIRYLSVDYADVKRKRLYKIFKRAGII